MRSPMRRDAERLGELGRANRSLAQEHDDPRSNLAPERAERFGGAHIEDVRGVVVGEV